MRPCGARPVDLVALATAVATTILAVACGSATDQVRGGDPRFDAARPEASAPDDAAEAADAAPAACDPGDARADAGAGVTWTDLYRDYFGPGAAASCAGNGTCHGDPAHAGARNSAFLCPADIKACYDGLTAPASPLVTPGDPDQERDPTTSGLYLTLRKNCLGGAMPKSSTFTFGAADLARIEAWIAAGAAPG
jgi:hypothetical protein